MKQSKKRKPTSRAKQSVAPPDVSLSDVDWDSAIDVDLDPALVESIRARQKLKQITLRIGQEQIAEARRVAKKTGVPYQTVLRRWVAEGASLSRSLYGTGRAARR